MKQALAAWIDLEEERHKMTLEALADVDAGRVIDHQDIQAGLTALRPTASGLRPQREDSVDQQGLVGSFAPGAGGT